jgi:hypothetical protein
MVFIPKNIRVVTKKTKGSKSLGPLRNGRARDVLQIPDHLKTECLTNRSRDSSVGGIATGYGVDDQEGREFESR